MAGVVESVLRKDVFVLRTYQDVRVLVHPVSINGNKFLPVVYGYATTIRRAQGATLELVALWFDKRMLDRGYAYVGCSRVRQRQDLYHVDKVRRSDWLPIGGDARGGEEVYPTAMSESSNSSDCDEPTSTSSMSEPSSERSSSEPPDPSSTEVEESSSAMDEP
eukprot:2868756-Amphidinium_carterae.2